MSSIPLDPKTGLNPALSICPSCGGEGQSIALLGRSNVFQCSCGRRHISYAGQQHKIVCPCGNRYRQDRHQFSKLGPADGWRDRVLDCEPCKKCQQEAEQRMAECKDEVERGGIFWKCGTCGSEGAIKAEHPLAQDVRAKMIKAGEIKAPEGGKHEPCGIDLGKFNLCPVCDEAAQAGKKEAANDTN